MSKQTKTNLEILAFSVLIGFLSGVGMLASCSAQAQETPVILPPDAPFAPPTADEFLLRGALAALLVGVVVRALREAFPDQLAPAGGATLTSKRLIIGICGLSGVLAGLVNLAPAVAPGVAGQIIGGLGTGLIAFVGAAAVSPKARLDNLGKVGGQDS